MGCAERIGAAAMDRGRRLARAIEWVAFERVDALLLEAIDSPKSAQAGSRDENAGRPRANEPLRGPRGDGGEGGVRAVKLPTPLP
jgi:hypothetical protein